MLRWIVALAVVFLQAGSASAAPSVTCKDAASGTSETVQLAALRKALAKLPQVFRQRSIHVADLSPELLPHRKLLPAAQAERDWCRVRAHVRALQDAVMALTVDLAFATEKFARIERVARGSGELTPGSQVDRLLQTAAKHLAAGKAGLANKALNQVWGRLLGQDDPWAVSERLDALLGQNPAGGGVTVSRAEIKEACPKLAAKAAAQAADLQRLVAQLGETLDGRRLRPLDVVNGDALVADAQSYVRLRAYWPAARALCALLARVNALEVNLGFVQARFHRVATWRGDNVPAAAEEARFAALVRDASSHIAERQYAEALPLLDELLVMMGEPAAPSASLPRLPAGNGQVAP